jgi:hypothetical protein
MEEEKSVKTLLANQNFENLVTIYQKENLVTIYPKETQAIVCLMENQAVKFHNLILIEVEIVNFNSSLVDFHMYLFNLGYQDFTITRDLQMHCFSNFNKD